MWVTMKDELWPWDGLVTTVTGAGKKHWEKVDIVMGKHEAAAVFPSPLLGRKDSCAWVGASAHTHVCFYTLLSSLHVSGDKLI